MVAEALWPDRHALFLALFHYHRLSHDACDRGGGDAVGFGGVVGDGFVQQGALRPYPYRRTVLAFRGCRMDRVVLYLLSDAIAWTARMSELDPRGPAPETHNVHFLWLLFGASAAPLA